MPLSFVSLFSGLGGLDLGFCWEGFKPVWAGDISEAAVSTYRANFGHEAHLADIASTRLSDLPRADVLIGGPPCQAFSLVGKRDPYDPRGRLVFAFVDAVRAVRPDAFVMENVPGLAASRVDGVRLPEILVSKLSSFGYNVVAARLKAEDYCVPQLRRRLFLIGTKADIAPLPTREEFARRVFNREYSACPISAESAIGDLGEPTRRGESSPYASEPLSPLTAFLRTNSADSVTLHEAPTMSPLDRQIARVIPPGGNYRDIPDALSTTRVLKFKQTGGRTTAYSRLHPDRPSYTVNTQFRRPNVGSNIHYSQPRLITAREAMRFQSIPDHFAIDATTIESRNALIGNAVPPLLARAVAISIKRSLRG